MHQEYERTCTFVHAQGHTGGYKHLGYTYKSKDTDVWIQTSECDQCECAVYRLQRQKSGVTSGRFRNALHRLIPFFIPMGTHSQDSREGKLGHRALVNRALTH